MGAAAYNRGSKVISQQIQESIEAHRRHEAFFMMDNLNVADKRPSAPTPFGPIDFVFLSDGYCWALDPVKGTSGYGYPFKTLREAVKSFNVDVTGCVNGKWTAVPRKAVSADQLGAKHD